MIPNERRESKNPIRYRLSLGWVRTDLRLIRTNLLNPILGRNASHPCLISLWLKEGCTIVCVSRSLPIPYLIGGRDESSPTKWITHTTVHPSLDQKLIRQGWEASLPDVGLSKFVRVGRRSIIAHPKANNT